MIIIKAPATVGIDLFTGQATPQTTADVGPRRSMMSFNLGLGFNALNPAASGLAFGFTGHVGIKMDPGDTLADFTFGFVQFMKQVQLNVTYAGRLESEGQVDADLLPLIGSDFMLDRSNDPAAASFSPFMQDPVKFRGFDSIASEIIAKTGDHPMINVPQRLYNSLTGVHNVLFSVVDRRQAVSVFVVRDKKARGGRTFVPLGHLSWNLTFNGTFKWREGHPLQVADLSSFSPGKPVKGEPTDKAIAALLANLSPSTTPVYNLKAQAAIMGLLAAPPNPNVRESKTTSNQIPPLFFLEGRGTLDIP